MNRRTTQILCLLAVALFAFIYWHERHTLSTEATAARRAQLLPDLAPNEVTSIEIIRTNQIIRVERKGDTWTLTLPVKYPAQRTSVESLLESLATTAQQTYLPAEEIMGKSGGFAAFGLEPATVTVVIQSGTRRTELRVGNQTVVGTQVYVQPVGTGGIAVSDATWLEKLPASANDWRDRSLLDLKGVTYDRISIRRPGVLPFDLARDPATRQWAITSPMSARADSLLIDHLVQALQDVRVMGFTSDQTNVDLEPYGLQPPSLELAFGQGTNDVAFLRFGKSPTNDVGQVYAWRSSHGNIVTASGEIPNALTLPLTRFRDPHLIALNSTNVYRLEVKADEAFALQKLTNGSWHITVPFVAPADAGLMADVMQNLTSLQIVEFVKDVVTDFASYGLAPATRTYVLLGATNETLAQLEFGTNQVDKVYVRRTDENSVYAARLGDSLRLPQAAYQLRDRKIWDFASSNVTSVTISQKGETRKIQRSATGGWVLAPGSQGMVETVSFQETLLRLGQLRAESWVARGEDQLTRYGFTEKDHKLTLELGNGETARTLVLSFGRLSPLYRPYAATVLEGQLIIFEFPSRLFADVQRDLSLTPPEPAP